MLRSLKLKGILTGMTSVLEGTVPITVKMRAGWDDKKPLAHKLVPQIQSWAHEGKMNIAAVMVHGRSRQQRYDNDCPRSLTRVRLHTSNFRVSAN